MTFDPIKTPGPTSGPGGESGAACAAQGPEPDRLGEPHQASEPRQATEPRKPAGEPEAPVSPATVPAGDDERESGLPDPEVPVDPAPSEAPVSPADVAALSERAQKADEYLDLAQRTRAEFENFRKRAAREAAAAQERGAAKLARELLPALDNLDRALAHAASIEEAGNGAATFVSGIKHVHADVLAALGRVGIEPFSPDGQPFDPQLHEAVAQQPVEGAASGTVVEVYQRGYRLGESVLRPARVVVAA